MNRSKATLAGRVADTLEAIEGVRSITFVGSFVDRDDLSHVSDVDTVVIFDVLTPARFRAATEAIEALTGDDIGFPGRRVIVNNTLGPLKFDAPDVIVVHLMLYDTSSHREHVLKSPFTCLDWERSAECRGTPLGRIYPVGRLQPGDFLGARRGLANYVSDLETGRISFRRFEPADGRMTEVPDSRALDRRHAGEYSYHIVRNLIANALKMRLRVNELWSEVTLVELWKAELPELAEWICFYEELRQAKLARGMSFPVSTLTSTRAFLSAFSSAIDAQLSSAFRLSLVRHARTSLNDGTFLGRVRDPDVTDPLQPIAPRPQTIYSSPLTRAITTAKGLAPGLPVTVDARLTEIDYGAVEGLTAARARERHPALAAAWDAGIDVPFPGGEDTAQVLSRAREFLDSLPAGAGHAIAVTHNVVIRTIVADMLGLDLRRAFRIPVEHLDPIEICRMSGRWVPNFGPMLKARFLDGYVG